MNSSHKSLEFRILIWSITTFAVLLCGVVIALIFGFIKSDSVGHLGSLGDALGGTTAPILGSLAIVVTFLAFWIQYEANQEIRRDIRLDRFENKFYELLRLHQYNVDSLEVSGKFKGRKAFEKMHEELRYLFYFVERELNSWNEINERKLNYDKSNLMDLAYTIFFFGLQETRNNKFYIKNNLHTPFAAKVIMELNKLKNRSKNEKKDGFTKFKLEEINDVTWKPSYIPFQGHVSKLGHYYRHLYQLFKFICSNPTLENNKELTYSYVKIVRAQLSNHEQALIYFNSFFNAGKIWWQESDPNLKNEKGERLSYFLDYGIIKNLPFHLTKFGPEPEMEFRLALSKRGRKEEEIDHAMEKLFEWIGG
ncbi:putative phage abortive infection protein [Lunatibacter salilacus]|uniref:putative phage abortive infection protein n=1 Tax=Lunatibacter salilacus TaxID=2483804 RepID=UPI00131C1B37|nr:putative phage abortive infection protein [Lunatibacter salilacus]